MKSLVNTVDTPKNNVRIQKCGYCLSFEPWSPSVLDVDGCLLPKNHTGPHEFKNLEGEIYQWEYDLEVEQDVFWKKG